MKDYNVVLQVEYAISARTREQAEERAQDIADAIQLLPQLQPKRWWPVEISKDEPQVMVMQY